MKQFLILLVFLTISFYSSSISQEEMASDTTDEYEEWDLDFWMPDVYVDKDRVILEGDYLMSTPSISQDVFNNDFSQINGFSVRLGNADYGTSVAGTNLLKFEMGLAVDLRFTNSDIDVLGNGGKINTSINSYGLYDEKGYGYLLGGDASIILTHGGSINWNTIEYTNPEGVVDFEERNKLERYRDQIRFGDSYEAGIRVRVIDNIGFYGSYSENIIYPRHLFLYWSVGYLIEGIGHGIANTLINKIKKSSPYLVPVAHFLIQNGISYGFYRLRENNMNWPFNTTEPLIQQNYRLGLSLIF